MASTNDPTVIAKYKLGYSECVQECIRFVNNNTNGMAQPAAATQGANPNNNSFNPNSIDPAARQRLIANLVRQFQSINQGPNGAQPMTAGFPIPNQMQLENLIREQQLLQLQNASAFMQTNKMSTPAPPSQSTSALNLSPSFMNKFKNEPQQANQLNCSTDGFNNTSNASQISPVDVMSLSNRTNSSSVPSSPDISCKMNNTRNSFRRSSVSPISASSSCSSNSCQNQLNSNESNSYQNGLENSNQDMLNSSHSPKSLDTSDLKNNEIVWRPW